MPEPESTPELWRVNKDYHGWAIRDANGWLIALTAIWVHAERIRQDRKWGGWEHDSQHTTEEWIAILQERLDKLREAHRANSYEIERRAVELTAVGWALLEQLHRRAMEKAADSLHVDSR